MAQFSRLIVPLSNPVLRSLGGFTLHKNLINIVKPLMNPAMTKP